MAIGYGTDCNDEVLVEFTGNRETVLHTNNVNELKKLIKFAVVTSSKVASRVKNISADDENLDANDNTQKTADAFKAQGSLIDNDDLSEWGAL